MRPETILQKQIRAHLTAKGYRSVACSNGAVLAGGPRERAIQMNVLKSAGLVPGFPDLIVYGPDKVGHIEVKLEGEKQADNQVEVEGWLTKWGHRYAVCRSLADVDETLGKWGWA
jgi:hypothetical protein